MALIALTALSGCMGRVRPVPTCHVDESLIAPLRLSPAPLEGSSNGMLAKDHKDLREQVRLDNPKKEEILKQIRKCNGE